MGVLHLGAVTQNGHKYVPAIRYTFGNWSSNNTTIPLGMEVGFGVGTNNLKGPVKITMKVKSTAGAGGIYNTLCDGYTILPSGETSTVPNNDVWYYKTWRMTCMYPGPFDVKFEVTFDGSTAGYNFKIYPPALPVGAPTGRSAVYNETPTTVDRSAVVGTWGSNATAGTWTWYYGIGNYNLSSGGSTYTTLYNLQPGTQYNYKFTITNGQKLSTVYYGTFNTTNYVYPGHSITLNSVTNNSISFNYSMWGTTIDGFLLYVNGASWGFISSGAEGVYTVSGLAPKTTYEIKIQPHTPVGDLYGDISAGPVVATTYPNPVWVNSASTYVTNIQPFSAQAVVTSNAPGDTNGYGFTLLDANYNIVRAETVRTGNTYTFSSLTPETTYIARVRVRTSNSNAWSGYYDMRFTTPADQASVFLKVNNVWRRAKVWLKVQGSWLKAKAIYTKDNTGWRKGNNS